MATRNAAEAARVWQAFGIAPLAALAAATIAIEVFLVWLSLIEKNEILVPMLVITPFYVFMIGLPIAYALTGLVCWPVYLALTASNALTRKNVLIAATLIGGLAPTVILGAILDAPIQGLLLPTVLMLISGLVGGLTFCRIALSAPEAREPARNSQ